VNAELAKLDDAKNVRFLDIGEKLAPGGKVTKEVFADGVHLTEKGFQIWAEEMLPLLKAMMQ
jgi:lysophospholipase L1-like esterase